MDATFAASLAANLYFGIFLVVAAFGLIFGYFTVRGSGINNHPIDGRDAAPGSKLPDEFHQFADRQVHDADVRRAARGQRPAPSPAPAIAYTPAPAPAPADDMTIDDVNERLAAEAAARKAATREHVARD